MLENFAEYYLGSTVLGCNNSSQENHVPRWGGDQGGAVPAGRQGKKHETKDYSALFLSEELIGQPHISSLLIQGYMKFFCHWLLTGLILIAQSVCGQENAVPNRELRGVWVTTVFSLDWPKTTGVATQKNELINIFDKARETNLNAIFLQIRTECDALYNSNLEPWSRYLTGVQGQDPGYDHWLLLSKKPTKGGWNSMHG